MKIIINNENMVETVTVHFRYEGYEIQHLWLQIADGENCSFYTLHSNVI